MPLEHVRFRALAAPIKGLLSVLGTPPPPPGSGRSARHLDIHVSSGSPVNDGETDASSLVGLIAVIVVTVNNSNPKCIRINCMS